MPLITTYKAVAMKLPSLRWVPPVSTVLPGELPPLAMMVGTVSALKVPSVHATISKHVGMTHRSHVCGLIKSTLRSRSNAALGIVVAPVVITAVLICD